MDQIISADEARRICRYERLLPVFRQVHSASIHCDYCIKEVRLYKREAIDLEALGYDVKHTKDYKDGLAEYIVSWL